MIKAVIIIGMGLTYTLTETIYFGNHLFPSSDAEVVADGIGAVIMAIGIATIKTSPNENH